MTHLATALEQVDRGTGALARGDRGQARRCFLMASRELLIAAKDAPEEQRTLLMGQANRLLRNAQCLDGGGEAPSVVGPAGATSSSAPFAIAGASGLALADVAGLDEVKRSFKAKFLYPLRHPEAAARYKQTGAGGMLLYGPPGTGKTYLVRALAGELGAPVFTVKPSEILSKWVGESEQNLAKLFEQANHHPAALIFIDEIDALAPARSGGGGDSVMERLVPQLLAELDGFARRSNRLLFLGASNEPWALDPAMMRPGRFDELCFVGLPDSAARETMLAGHLEGVPVSREVKLAELAELTAGYTGADLFGISMKATQAAYVELIETGRERPVDRTDFEQAIAGTPHSVTPRMLQRYQDFAAGRQP